MGFSLKQKFQFNRCVDTLNLYRTEGDSEGPKPDAQFSISAQGQEILDDNNQNLSPYLIRCLLTRRGCRSRIELRHVASKRNGSEHQHENETHDYLH
jgi:hypothetical protein